MSNDLPNDDFDADAIALDHLIGIMVSFYKGFKNHGLTSQEAAALTAACLSQSMPQELEGPRDGS